MWEPVVAPIVTFVIGLLLGKPVWKRFLRSAKELHDVFGAVLRAVEDGKIEESEVREIVKEAKEFVKSIKEG